LQKFLEEDRETNAWSLSIRWKVIEETLKLLKEDMAA
jgi:hypothetical protein